ncbi:MAG: hypothetical protein OEQ12_06705 [Nitrosopumilus sp.]|nr:hypothetical protein [Nitrosopumilus sp.]
MKNIFVLYLMMVLLIPLVHAHALPGDVELVLDDIGIVPTSPEKGDLVSITADVYNAGLKNTNSLTSIITAAYFVDGNLLHVDEIGNIEPGLSNKIKIISSPIWRSEMGNHEIKVIVDYHNTLNDQYDSPLDNSMSKILFIEPLKNTQILLEAFPHYLLQDEKTSKITVSLFDPASNEFLNNQKILLTLDGHTSTLITDKQGKVSFSTTMPLSNQINIEAYFDGDSMHYPSNSSLTLYSFPKEISSSLVLKLSDSDQYNFENYLFDILIFQDSYEKLIKKIQPDSTTLLDSETFWISLPSGHNYFAEIYLNGRIFFVTDQIQLQEDSIIVKKLKIPEMGKVKFVVTDDKNQLVTGSTVTNWIYSFSAEDGFTEWMDVIPATREPYVAETILSDRSILKSEPFLIFPGEQKIIDITAREKLSKYKIPPWIKNNADWWADDLIDDSSFVQGIQFLIQERIILIPPTLSNLDESPNEIPPWIKNNADWWADDLIDDSSFVQGIQFMIKEGLIKLS